MALRRHTRGGACEKITMRGLNFLTSGTARHSRENGNPEHLYRYVLILKGVNDLDTRIRGYDDATPFL